MSRPLLFLLQTMRTSLTLLATALLAAEVASAQIATMPPHVSQFNFTTRGY